MKSARWTSARRALVSLVAGALLSSSLATVAFAADKTFTASVAPGALVAGASYGSGARSGSPLSLTITNTSNQARLGSANVTPPAGVLATAATSSVGSAAVVGGVIQLRNLDLAPDGAVVVAVTAQVECAANHASYTWGLISKQANDFNGTGNDLMQVGSTTNSVTGTCGIVFSKQPASSEKAPVTITSKIYDPSGAEVTVTVKDGAGLDTVTWWTGTIALSKGDDPTGGLAVLGGGTSGSASGGSVTFTPTIDRSATGFSLIATASPTAGSASVGTSTAGLESANFNIVDDATICQASTACSAEAGQGNKTGAKVDATATGGAQGDLVILAIGDPTLVVDCAGYVETSDVVEYNVTAGNGVDGSGRAKQATLTLAAAFVTKSASKYEVCYTSDSPFTDKFGNTVSPGNDGLLPACKNRDPVLPCVLSTTLDKQKNLVIVVSSPPGDPAGKF
jgi:hypothetical protein